MLQVIMAMIKIIVIMAMIKIIVAMTMIITITITITILSRCPWATARLFHSRLKVLKFDNHRNIIIFIWLKVDNHPNVIILIWSSTSAPLSLSFVPSLSSWVFNLFHKSWGLSKSKEPQLSFWLFYPALFVKTCQPIFLNEQCSIQTPYFSSLPFTKPLFIGRATTWPTSGSTFTSGR